MAADEVVRSLVLEFYNDSTNFEMLHRIHTSRTVQARLIDYFITQYCKSNPFFILAPSDHGITDIYNNYKLQLKGFHKKYFSLFEKKRLAQVKNATMCIELPLSQLNMYKWIK